MSAWRHLAVRLVLPSDVDLQRALISPAGAAETEAARIATMAPKVFMMRIKDVFKILLKKKKKSIKEEYNCCPASE